jgi:hypothetical protein
MSWLVRVSIWSDIYRTRFPFLQKRSPWLYWSEAWMKDGIWSSYTLSSYPFGSLHKCFFEIYFLRHFSLPFPNKKVVYVHCSPKQKKKCDRNIYIPIYIYINYYIAYINTINYISSRLEIPLIIYLVTIYKIVCAHPNI